MILSDIKQMLGVDQECTEFDLELMATINSNVLALHQMGFGKDNFLVTNVSDEWVDFLIPDEMKYLSYIKQYIFLRTKMVFDASASSTISESLTNAINELEWRLMLEKEDKVGENQNGS